MKEALVYLLAITIAEVVTVTIQPLWGIACHIALLVALILHSALVSRQTHRQLLLSLALVPLVRIISLSMPLANIPQVWWYPIIYAPLLVAAIVVVRILDLSPEDMMVRCPNCGQKTGVDSCQWCNYPVLKSRPTKLGKVGLSFGFVPVQLLVALSGLVLGVAEYLILKPELMVSELTWQGIWLWAVIYLVCSGFVEEFIFRGVLQHTALAAVGGWGIVYVSLLFAILHLGHYPSNPPLSYWDVPFVFVIALFFAWVVKKTGSLLGVTLSHGITNIVLYLIAPFFF